MTHRTLALSNEVHFLYFGEKLIYCGFKWLFFAASGRFAIQNDAPASLKQPSVHFCYL